jgi:hypothetical protein
MVSYPILVHLLFNPIFHDFFSIDMMCRMCILLFLVAREWSSDIEESDSDDELAELYPLFSRYVQQHIGALTPKATGAGNGGTVH